MPSVFSSELIVQHLLPHRSIIRTDHLEYVAAEFRTIMAIRLLHIKCQCVLYTIDFSDFRVYIWSAYYSWVLCAVFLQKAYDHDFSILCPLYLFVRYGILQHLFIPILSTIYTNSLYRSLANFLSFLPSTCPLSIKFSYNYNFWAFFPRVLQTV